MVRVGKPMPETIPQSPPFSWVLSFAFPVIGGLEHCLNRIIDGSRLSHPFICIPIKEGTILLFEPHELDITQLYMIIG